MSHSLNNNSSPDAQKIDMESINQITFIPDAEQRNELYQVSIKAIKDIEEKNRSKLLSKQHYLPGNMLLCPDDLNPNHTIYVTQAFEKTEKCAVWNIDKGETCDRGNELTVVNDKNMPFGAGLNSSNIVLKDCHNKYGSNRINLFYKNEAETLKLAQDVVSFRNINKENIFKLFVVYICESYFTIDFKLDPDKTAKLDDKMRSEYINMCSLYRKVLECVSTFTTASTIDRLTYMMKHGEIEKKKFPYVYSLEECGINCISLCQTWLREGSPVYEAQFNVMSPHFQTRFYIENQEKLQKIAGVTDEELTSYVNMIQYLDKVMAKEHSNKTKGATFINVDELLSVLKKQTPSIQCNIQ